MIEPTSEESKRALANFIAQRIVDDFEFVHFSGNLANTIRIENDKGKIRVIVPAVKYDLGAFKSRGVIIYQEEQGSYAEKVNKKGGFSKKHKGYVERAIGEGIEEWLAYLGIKAVSIDVG